MLKNINPIPRAIYYMSPLTALKSIFKLVFKKLTYKDVSAFEKEFSKSVDCKFGISTSYARISLYLSLKSMKLKPGDEVLLTAVNLPDMINMILLNNLKPVFVDYDKHSFNISIEDMNNKITEKTKVIFSTVLSGILSNIQEVYKIANKNKIIVIQDLTQSYDIKIPPKNNDIATLSEIAIYSLCDLKDIHTHRGSMIVTSDESLYQDIKNEKSMFIKENKKRWFWKFILQDFVSTILLRRSFFRYFIFPVLKLVINVTGPQNVINLTRGDGIKVGPMTLGKGVWGGDGDFIRKEIPESFKYKYTDIQAQIGLIQLKKHKKRVQRRKSNAALAFQYIHKDLVPFKLNEFNSYWKFPILVERPDLWQKKLLEHGIDAAPTNLTFLPGLDFFKDITDGKAPNARVIVENIIYLPIHYYLTKDEVLKVIEIVNKIKKSFNFA